MKKIILNKPRGQSVPEGIFISDERMTEMLAQSRWCPGIALMSGHKVECTRLKTIDGYIYKVNGQITEHADAFSPSEFMAWRDGTINENQI